MSIVIGCFHHDSTFSVFQDRVQATAIYKDAMNYNKSEFNTTIYDAPFNAPIAMKAYFPDFRTECPYC